jgi:hypothetical protein
MKFRQPLKITSRTSSITNSFVQAIIPFIEPTREETDEALHWSNLQGIEQKMKDAQQHATVIRSAIMAARRS